MNGNVQGLPTTVPIAAATALQRVNHAPTMAKRMWKPIKGVKDIAAPHAKPPAMAYPEPGKRPIRYNVYRDARRQPIWGQKASRTRLKREIGVLR